jgi:4-amino-4-deoxy-L-arabinose transferase-like glycosyltransferase
MKYKKFILFCIIVLAVFLRLYKLGEVPPGFHPDEVSQAYNAFSILKTAHDRYGEFLPILFRSFANYQPPVYTYLAPIPIFIFGNTIFAARFTSGFFGVLTVILTYFLSYHLVKQKYREKISLVFALVVAISPWSVHFSRRVVEGNLGIFFFLLAFYLLLKSLKNIRLFPIATLVVAVSTHAYYSERLIAAIFLPTFLVYYRDYFIKQKKWVFLGFLTLVAVLLPHAVTIMGGAFASRFMQVASSGGNLILDFIKHYLSYYSPKSLFSDIGSNLGRISPGLGVFYAWMFAPFLAGIYFLRKFIESKYTGVLGIFLLVSLVPVALTGDVFYPLRALEFLWILSFVISIGLVALFGMLKNNYIKGLIAVVLPLYSLSTFYTSYFVLFKHESTEDVGQAYVTLFQEFQKYKNYSMVIDSARDPAIGLRIAYLSRFNPAILQKELRPQMVSPYYSDKVELNDVYTIGNITVRAINWGKDSCAKNTIIVGDNLAISDTQMKDHHLTKLFEIESVNKDFVLSGYGTNPSKDCL